MQGNAQHALYKHGHSRPTPTYQSWQAMLNRCRNPRREKFADYGGRGISVCERWLDFKDFLADMGVRPAGTSLDRINNDGNYEPGNCRWATPKEQRRNNRQLRLLTHNGRTQCVTDWCKEFGVKYETAIYRMNQGMTFEQIMAPIKSKKTHCKYGHPYSGKNLYVAPSGQRTCIECRKEMDRKRRPFGSRCKATWTRKAKAA